jgi:phosphoglycolate phosphatase
VADTLEGLKMRGARLGVLTNKPQELTDPLLPLLGLEGMFATVYGAGRKPYTKPDPRIFHDVVAASGGGPAVMIGDSMIGDSITDLNTARAAGAPCILMSYGFTPVPASELGADVVLDDFADLPEAIRQLGLG